MKWNSWSCDYGIHVHSFQSTTGSTSPTLRMWSSAIHWSAFRESRQYILLSSSYFEVCAPERRTFHYQTIEFLFPPKLSCHGRYTWMVGLDWKKNFWTQQPPNAKCNQQNRQAAIVKNRRWSVSELIVVVVVCGCCWHNNDILLLLRLVTKTTDENLWRLPLTNYQP
jgi:hypothetical protein